MRLDSDIIYNMVIVRFYAIISIKVYVNEPQTEIRCLGSWILVCYSFTHIRRPK